MEHQQETFALAALALKSAGAEPKDGIPALAEPKRSEFGLVSSRGVATLRSPPRILGLF